MIRIISDLLSSLQAILAIIIVLRNSPTRVHQRKKNFDKTQRILSKLRYIVLLVTIFLEIYIKDYTSALIHSVFLLIYSIYDVNSPYWH